MHEDQKGNTVRGTVVEALANAHFRVEIPDTEAGEGTATKTILAYLAGKMRLHRIRVIVGDSVEVLLDPYGGKARIIRRH